MLDGNSLISTATDIRWQTALSYPAIIVGFFYEKFIQSGNVSWLYLQISVQDRCKVEHVTSMEQRKNRRRLHELNP